jgi:hypothetical protein
MELLWTVVKLDLLRTQSSIRNFRTTEKHNVGEESTDMMRFCERDRRERPENDRETPKRIERDRGARCVREERAKK